MKWGQVCVLQGKQEDVYHMSKALIVYPEDARCSCTDNSHTIATPNHGKRTLEARLQRGILALNYALYCKAEATGALEPRERPKKPQNIYNTWRQCWKCGHRNYKPSSSHFGNKHMTVSPVHIVWGYCIGSRKGRSCFWNQRPSAWGVTVGCFLVMEGRSQVPISAPSENFHEFEIFARRRTEISKF